MQEDRSVGTVLSGNDQATILRWGCLCVAIGLICNVRVARLLAADGSLSAATDLRLWILDIICVSFGILLIAGRKSDRSPVVCKIGFSVATAFALTLGLLDEEISLHMRSNLTLRRLLLSGSLLAVVMLFSARSSLSKEVGRGIIGSALATLVSLVALDNVVYSACPWLPASMVERLSAPATVRYMRFHPSESPWRYAENIRYARPFTVVDGHKSDEFGYSNPANYLSETEKMDIVLLGDSFIWGSEDRTVADHLREDLAPLTVYSMGITGEGMSQWRYHYQRFVQSLGYAPAIVVLNFYSGNDIGDTLIFHLVREKFGKVSSAAYFAYGKRRLDLDLTLPRFLSLLELRSLMSAVMTRFSFTSAEPEPAPSRSPQPSDLAFLRYEPLPEQFNETIQAEIAETVRLIRSKRANTSILLSYIPTSSAIYGPSTQTFPNGESGKACVERQNMNSNRLGQIAESLGIEYLDSTPDLQNLAKTKSMWRGAHFSPEGYEAYSSALADKVSRMINRQGA